MKVLKFGILFTLALPLTACSSGEKEEAKPEKPPTEVTEDENKEQENKPESNLPPTMEKEVEIEGMKEKRPATLQESEGYHFYMLDLYEFEKEDETKGKIAFANKPEFYATIEKLDPSADIEALKEASIKQAEEQTGNASDLPATDIYFPYFHDAEFFVKGLSDDYDVVMYLVKEVEGERFYFSLHISSSGGEMEGVEPSLWAMLETVKPN
ncbi:hypothetical protein [Fictibacillus phosphorivorans]|uniref:hypothetical protein n=1 Tax=Fictibacillus phosphorivorans TaxID=1221500 RepID=UPI00203E5C5D|nr:hypothetical protein [Fictibacillus phosphorivorans]MCM3718562.1 hypothetical protein [Fictibacillus phosphorivorans]MCM3776082.1 hypothetical protein [Fictibacillus phosphorivorans]